MADLISTEAITNKIFVIRGKKVMLDRDLAQLYEVTTKRLNEQVKRNGNSSAPRSKKSPAASK